MIGRECNMSVVNNTKVNEEIRHYIYIGKKKREKERKLIYRNTFAILLCQINVRLSIRSNRYLESDWSK